LLFFPLFLGFAIASRFLLVFFFLHLSGSWIDLLRAFIFQFSTFQLKFFLFFFFWRGKSCCFFCFLEVQKEKKRKDATKLFCLPGGQFKTPNSKKKGKQNKKKKTVDKNKVFKETSKTGCFV